jgi:hypothetical protein
MKYCMMVLILIALLAGGAFADHGYATVLDSFSTSDWAMIPAGIAYDGSNLWITENNTSNLFKVTTSGSLISSYSLSPITYPSGLSWDGSAFWMIGIASGTTRYFYHVSTTGSIMSSISGVLSYPFPYDLVYLAGNSWVSSDYYDRKIYLHSMGNGAILNSLTTIVKYPCGICYDGTNLLVSGNDDGRTHRYSTTGTYLDFFEAPFESNYYTGGSVWVNGNIQTVYHISVDWNPPAVEPSSLGVVRSLFR